MEPMLANTAIETELKDVIIVGAGPAGLAAAVQAKKNGLNYLILEASDEIANTIHSFAQGKWIMAEPLSIPQRSDLDFRANAKESILDSWRRQLADHNLDIEFGARVVGIDHHGQQLHITTQKGEHHLTRKLVLAFGVQGKPIMLGKDIDPASQTFYQVPKNETWTKKRILVVGAGDSAVEESILLSEHNQIMLLNRKQSFSRCKAGNQSAIKAAIENGKLQCRYESEIISIHPLETGRKIVHFRTPTGLKKVEVDHVLARIGTQSPANMLAQLGLNFDYDNAGHIKTTAYGESSLPGVYAIGALSGQALIKQGMNQGVVCIDHLMGKPVRTTEMLILEETLRQADIKTDPDRFSSWVQSLGCFKELPQDALNELLMHAQITRFAKTTEIMSSGEFCEDLYIVVKGELSVSTDTGETFSIHKGETAGELTLLSKQASLFNVVATKGSYVLRLPHSALSRFVKANEGFRQALHKLFLKRTLKWLMLPTIPNHLLELFLKQSHLRHYSTGERIDGQNEALFVVVNGSVALTCGKGMKLVQGGGLIGFQEALGKQPIPSLEIKQDHTTIWELPVSLIWGFETLNPKVVSERVNADKGLVENHLPHQFGIVDPSKLEFFQKENLGNAGNVLVIDKNKCVGCDQCEVACASTHEGVSRLNRKAGVKMDNLLIANACRHCKNPDCLKECPADAISRNSSGEIVISDSCIGCGNCSGNCPYGVISIAESKPPGSLVNLLAGLLGKSDKNQANTGQGKAVKCDLCVNSASGPACVQACPTSAASRVNPETLISAVNL